MNPDVIRSLPDIIITVFAGASILTAVVAIGARLALKPVMEAWLRLRQASSGQPGTALQDRRIELLETELQSLQKSVQSLVEAEEFRRQLGSSFSVPGAQELPTSRGADSATR